jgi:hypothetical protein
METEHKVGPLAFHLQAYNNEAQILERLVYRNLNQHRRTRVFQLIKKVKNVYYRSFSSILTLEAFVYGPDHKIDK